MIKTTQLIFVTLLWVITMFPFAAVQAQETIDVGKTG
ncbi:MAG: hypothetical protein H6Q17_1414 [Bacteroidetes bacterium]|nr:hypothetical protein [Bacteroidota bacterium]